MSNHGHVRTTLIIALLVLSGCDQEGGSGITSFGGMPAHEVSNVDALEPATHGRRDATAGRFSVAETGVRRDGTLGMSPGPMDMAMEPDLVGSVESEAMPGGDEPETPSNTMEPSAESTGFGPRPVRWSVPESASEDGFFVAWYATNTQWYSTMDLTGDGIVDLIQSGDDGRNNGFVWRDDQGPFWKVWPGQANGFAPDYVRWWVPESGLNDGFFYTGWSHGTRWFSTRDLNGDSIPDLVQTADPTREGGFVWRDADGSYWKVWLGRDGGFSRNMTRWAVPNSGLDDGFFALSWANDTHWFSTMDLTGDGRLDLIQTADPNRPGGHVFGEANGAYWKVWPGIESGFSQDFLRWPVPASGMSDGFFYTAWSQSERSFTTMDITGDGHPDLVQTADSQQSGGYVWHDDLGAYWKVWPGNGRGFARAPIRWSVPESGLGDGFFTPWWSQGERGFATIDLTGDGQPDLIQTADPDQPGGFVWRDAAGPHWLVWPGRDNGFSEIPVRWPVPESGLEDGFFVPSWSMGERWFTTMDLNGDRRPDMVQTGTSNRTGGYVWRDDIGPFWKVWLNQ
jgi:hypothetical protein